MMAVLSPSAAGGNAAKRGGVVFVFAEGSAVLAVKDNVLKRFRVAQALSALNVAVVGCRSCIALQCNSPGARVCVWCAAIHDHACSGVTELRDKKRAKQAALPGCAVVRSAGTRHAEAVKGRVLRGPDRSASESGRMSAREST